MIFTLFNEHTLKRVFSFIGLLTFIANNDKM